MPGTADQRTKDGASLSPREIAERWGVPLKTVYARTRGGQLRAFRVGKNYRSRISWIHEYEDRNLVHPRSPEQHAHVARVVAAGLEREAGEGA